jgi:hypothetical protein
MKKEKKQKISSIMPCPECGKLIALIFPLHECVKPKTKVKGGKPK